MAVRRWLLVPVALGACGLDPVPMSTATTGTSGTGAQTDDGESSEGSSGSTGADMIPEPGPEPYGSGSRLRAIEVVTPEDGALLLAFHDTELDIDCVFATSEDGVIRCVPWWGRTQLSMFRRDPVASSRTEFARRAESCDGTVAILEACLVQDGAQISLPPPGSCLARVQRADPFRVGARVPDSDPCLGELLPGQVAHALEPIDPAVYAAATEVDTATTHALVTNDGAWVHAFVRDDDGRVCDGEWTGRCFPGPIIAAVGWADAECSVPALIDPPYCDVPVLGISNGEFRVVTDELDTVFVGGADACAPEQRPGYATGEVVDLESLSPLSTASEGEGSVVVRLSRRAEDGTAVQDFLWDKDTESRCRVLWRDGEPACERERGLPGPSSRYFDDASCTEPVYRVQEFTFSVAVPTPECGNQDGYVPHDAVRSSYPDYELTDSGDCMQAFDTLEHYVPGKALPDDGYFMPLQYRVQ